MKKATLHTDGGARGNPGPAGIGAVLEIEGEEPVSISDYIGETTNNQAEYQALARGLKEASDRAVTHLTCYLDSELVVKQLNGEYRVKNPEILSVFTIVQRLMTLFEKVTFNHVRREKNKLADKLVNEAIDHAKRGA